MKIHIIGAPGSGKSFLADNLSKQFDIPQMIMGQKGILLQQGD